MKKAVIFDLDNTILFQTNRNPFNWSDLSGDVISPEMEQMIELFLESDYAILFVTGRPESAKENTQKFLLEKDIPYDRLYMKQGNPKKKAVVHKEATLLEIQKEFNVVLAFEDDDKCAEMYVRNKVMTLMPLNYKIPKKGNQTIIPFS